MARQLVRLVNHIGSDPGDDEELRLKKSVLNSSAFMVIPAGPIWGAIYFLFGEPIAASIPLAYSVMSAVSIVLFASTRRYRFYRFSQLALILILPWLLMAALGGFINSSAVVLWSILSPFGALLFEERENAPKWFAAYFILVVSGAVLEPFMRSENNLSPALLQIFFVLNILANSTIAFVLVYYFVGQKNSFLELLRVEQQKSENLLLNILPKEIAAILKNENRTIAEHFDGASILFADLVGFTPMTVELAPTQMVELLNEVFSHFDSLVEKYDLEKIRTIGDNYLAVAGVPRPRPDHAIAMASMALDMRDYISQLPPRYGKRLVFRVGINSGAVVGGVIGRRKFVYDVWGDAVNIASRMESQGAPGEIQITRATYEQVKHRFDCEYRGTIPVKGRGDMDIWFLRGQKR